MMNDNDTWLTFVRQRQDALDAQAARIEATYAEHERRLLAVEAATGGQIRVLEARVADQTETLRLAGETMTAVMDTCRRHGFDPACGLSALEWLEYVLSTAAAGWSSVN